MTNATDATREQRAPQQLAPAQPVNLPPPGIARSAARIARISAGAARQFAPVAGRKILRREGDSARAARELLEGLGSTYVKFGQFIAAAPGIVGEEMAAEFRTCLDAGPPVPFAEVRRIVEAETGKPLSETFASFGEQPIAAASIAVVHKATLRDGSAVAVKVLRPGIEQQVATDMAILDRFARGLAAAGADGAYTLVGLVVSLRAQIAEELDFRNEATTMDAFRDMFALGDLSMLVVPRAYHESSGRRVLTMELLDGVAIDDLSAIERMGFPAAPLVRELLRAWVLCSMRVGAFHADIHAGNMMLLNDGRLGMLDWGIVSRIEGDTMRMFRGLCRAAIGDDSAWPEISDLMRAANGASFYAIGLTDEDIDRFTRATFTPMMTLPVREVNMSDFFMNGDEVVRRATGQAPPKRTLRDRIQVMRASSKAYREGAASGVFEHPTLRFGFLSSKQMIYLERYARLYIPDELLFGDHDFLRRALDGMI